MVAGLSLGAPAIMHFRLHTKHEPNPEERHFAMTVILRHVLNYTYCLTVKELIKILGRHFGDAGFKGPRIL